MATKSTPPQKNYRDAGAGQYVPKSDAVRRPKETVSEPRSAPKKK